MARKNILTYQVASNQSLSSNFITPVTVIEYLDNCSYQINLTTTDSIGTFSVQGSNDYNQEGSAVVNPGNWISLTLGGGTPFVNAANDLIIIDLNQLPFSAIRLIYSSGTSGTGTCNIYLTCKQVGG